MELNRVRDIALKLLKKHNLRDWTFKWGTLDSMRIRDKYVLARCDYTLKNIILSRELTEHETNIDRLTNTILHEIAHAIDFDRRNMSNHDKVWQKIAKSIGCMGNKCGDISGVNMKKVAKWIAECPTCHKKFFTHIKPKTKMSCASCGGKGFNPNYLIGDYKPNDYVIKTYESFIKL